MRSRNLVSTSDHGPNTTFSVLQSRHCAACGPSSHAYTKMPHSSGWILLNCRTGACSTRGTTEGAQSIGNAQKLTPKLIQDTRRESNLCSSFNHQRLLWTPFTPFDTNQRGADSSQVAHATTYSSAKHVATRSLETLRWKVVKETRKDLTAPPSLCWASAEPGEHSIVTKLKRP